MPHISHLVIVGVGLLGSSIGLAVKKRNIAQNVIGVGNCPASLDTALRRGAVDHVTETIDYLSDIDAIDTNEILAVICTPVRTIVDYADRIATLNRNILISDVGSTKGNICYELDRRGCRFVGAHPIAGSEKSGPQFGDGDLFQNRLTVLTPTDSNNPNDVELLRIFWESLGSQVVCLKPNRHDEILAKTSHLPHALAVTLASLVDSAELPFCGTGFADTTRIAAGSSAVWTDIFLENRQHLLAALDEFSSRLDVLKTALHDGNADAVAGFLNDARKIYTANG